MLESSTRGWRRLLRVGRAVAALGLITLSLGCWRRRAVAPPSAPPPAPQAAPIPAPAAPPTAVAPPGAPLLEGMEGLASWYGHPYHGRHTASGEIYNMYAMTAAHRTLAFGTQVRVHNLENGRETVVRINDRGPFVEGRIIDLSYAAAQAMGMPSTALVRLEIIGSAATSVATQSSVFAVQVGAFKDRNNAQRLKALIEARHRPVVIQGFDRGDGYFYRVRVGQESTEDAARALAEVLRRENPSTVTFVVRLN